ncbi:hypothetical protein ACLQ2N_28860 [Streptomyces sp. DT224]|uniref:hypothetical protein n=1 Tax=Streptomyces sp. DT224 TaxID=3393426 RepID=UPI003CE884CD
MPPERHEGSGAGELPVPMAWMYAEYLAGELLRTGDLMEPATLEFRAGRDALALTIFLLDGAVAGALPAARVDELRLLTAAGAPWRRWVRTRLAAPVAGGTGADLALARSAWRWLEETELLAADPEAVGQLPPWEEAAEGAEEEARVWTPAWQLGLPLGHLAVHLY